jgi:GAF domain-containing protein
MTLNEAAEHYLPSERTVAGILLDLLAAAEQVGEIFADITQLAVASIPGCESASITVIHGAIASTVASTDARARAIDESQYSQGQGPCLQAARTSQSVQVDDIATTITSDLWRRTARHAQVTASLSMPLSTTANIEAALNVYTGAEGGWGADAYEHAERLSAYAGAAITVLYRMSHPQEATTGWPYPD